MGLDQALVAVGPGYERLHESQPALVALEEGGQVTPTDLGEPEQTHQRERRVGGEEEPVKPEEPQVGVL